MSFIQLAWLPHTQGLESKPQVMLVAKALRVTPDDAANKHMRMWHWARHYVKDGLVAGATPEMVDSVVGKAGFAQAVASVPNPWLVICDNGLRFPDWDRYMGSKEEKTAAAERKRRERLRKRDIGCDMSRDVSHLDLRHRGNMSREMSQNVT
jgi:hypothetical protein